MEAIYHRRVVASLAPALRETLLEKSDEPAFLRLAFHLGAIALIGALIASGAPFWLFVAAHSRRSHHFPFHRNA